MQRNLTHLHRYFLFIESNYLVYYKHTTNDFDNNNID